MTYSNKLSVQLSTRIKNIPINLVLVLINLHWIHQSTKPLQPRDIEKCWYLQCTLSCLKTLTKGFDHLPSYIEDRTIQKKPKQQNRMTKHYAKNNRQIASTSSFIIFQNISRNFFDNRIKNTDPSLIQSETKLGTYILSDFQVYK